MLDEALALVTGETDRAAAPIADDVTIARLLAKKAAFILFSGDLAERDALSARAVELVGEGTRNAIEATGREQSGSYEGGNGLVIPNPMLLITASA